MNDCSRRNFLHLAGAGALAGAASQNTVYGQADIPPAVPGPSIYPYESRSQVSLVKGEDRRKNVIEALNAIDKEIAPLLKRKKYVAIKVNNVYGNNQLCATHVDAIRGILDYLAPRFKGPVMIVESSAGETLQGFENYHYPQLIGEYKRFNLKLVDLNGEEQHEIFPIVDGNVRPVPVRLAGRLLDPDAFIISSAMLKTHNAVVATMSIKNMAMGAPLRRTGTAPFDDKRMMHAQTGGFGRGGGQGGRGAGQAGARGTAPTPGQGAPPAGARGGAPQAGRGVTRGAPFHAMNYNVAMVAKKLSKSWGVALIDGFEGMEGNGPASGTPVPMRVAIASTDFLAADRVGLETMGIPQHAVGYLQYAAQLGVGQFDLAKIDIRGERPEAVKRVFRLHDGVQNQLDWLREITRG
ncbi:MAG: DUF362 domain-containing protein [Candidatus Solibacter sp.]